jgi:DNA-binding NtrC family response regulator
MDSTVKHPILIVDDEPEILFSLRGLLRRDFDVHIAESGAEALEILRREPIHVLMTDQRMPQMSGAELLKHACGVSPHAIRIVFTGYADIKAVVGAINEGHVFRYLTKPWDPDELRELLLEAAKQHDVVVEQQRILEGLPSFLRTSLALAEGLRSGSLGAIAPTAQAELVQWADRANHLLGQLESLARERNQSSRCAGSA